MKVQTYSVKQLQDNRRWVLCSGKLSQYLSELNTEFFNFDIQRKIVDNHFLNSLYTSVENGMPFPAITLTSIVDFKEGTDDIDLNSCQIIDGLQRTFRLWSLWYTYELSLQHNVSSNTDVWSILSEDCIGKYIIETKVLNRTSLKELFTGEKIEDSKIYHIIKSFDSYDVIFNVWYNLSDEDVVKLMLILNAGQKSVSSIHQYELIYLRYFEHNKLNLPPKVKILRQREQSYAIIRTAEREIGTFALSSVMVAFQSYYKGKPLRVKQVNKIDFNDDVISSYFTNGMGSDALSNFIKCLYSLDSKIACINSYSKTWIAKDTTLSGIFAAIGQLTDANIDYDDFTFAEKYIESIQVEDLALDNFRSAYDSLSSVRVNVGSVVRNAIYKAFLTYVPGKQISWSNLF
jgi:hypothetical protein